ncbi:MAG: Tfp pilus assembly protein FimT/FimU [Phycisphaerales bacterium]
MRSCSRHRHAFSLVEAVISTLIVAGLLVASLSVVSQGAKVRLTNQMRLDGLRYAEILLAKVQSLPYADPNDTPILGIEVGDVTATPATYDDVDDFNGYQETPPTDAAWQAMPVASRWKMSVSVTYVDPDANYAVAATDTGVKKITVVASSGDKPYATLWTIRTQAWDTANTP